MPLPVTSDLLASAPLNVVPVHTIKRGPWLVADIGGTNARFGWVAASAASSPRVSFAPDHIRRYSVSEFATVEAAATAYLAEIAALLGARYAVPEQAAFAVATAVRDDIVAFTNSPWRFSRASLQSRLQVNTLLVLNDFEALALSLPGLNAKQLRFHGTTPAVPPTGTLAVIGPGTGLGVAGVVQTPSGWIALAGEGGHTTLAASDDFEAELLAVLRQTYPHVSAERVLSGLGLPLLHAAVTTVLGHEREATLALDAPQIVERGLAQTDAVCDRVIDVFCRLLGSFAGNMALTLGARGGVYIGGGIVPRLGERFFASDFRVCFEAKGRFEPYLKAIPTAVIADTLAALGGAALAIEQNRR
jgi:glucokinase